MSRAGRGDMPGKDSDERTIDLNRIGAQWSPDSQIGRFINSAVFRKVLLPLAAVVLVIKVVHAGVPDLRRADAVRHQGGARAHPRGARRAPGGLRHRLPRRAQAASTSRQMYLFPKDLQVIDLTGDARGGGARGERQQGRAHPDVGRLLRRRRRQHPLPHQRSVPGVHPPRAPGASSRRTASCRRPSRS